MNPRYFHVSSNCFDVGDILRPRGAHYEEDWKHSDFYWALERHRPPDKRAQKDAVFLFCDFESADMMGGEWIYEVGPQSPASRHDMNWTGEICSLVADGYQIDSGEIRRAATSYWNGEPSPNERLWEYLTSGAEILSVASCK